MHRLVQAKQKAKRVQLKRFVQLLKSKQTVGTANAAEEPEQC